MARHPLVHPRLLIWAVQLAIFAFSGFTAFLLRFEFRIDEREWPHIVWAIPIWLLAKALAFRALKLDCGWWGHTSVPDLVRLGAGNLIGSAAAAALILLLAPAGFPRSIYLLDLLLCANTTAGVRFLARLVKEAAHHGRQNGGSRRVLIYGAGAAGVTLLREIRRNHRLNYEVRGFVDDDPRKKGMRVQIVPVLGAGPDLPAIAGRHAIAEVLIALPSASGSEMVRILEHCHNAGVRCKTIPGLADVIEGSALASQIRDVAVEDLLGRTPIQLETEAIRAKLQDRVVLVTGAAGSIGSELCRQIARFDPRAVLACDIAETGLFELQQEMRRSFPAVAFHAEIGSIQNARRLGEVFELYSPSLVYHAAAYKHVPLMEDHIFEAVENNILGTANVALAAARYGVRDFVMISSDKAVRPTNIMGLTKRVAELLIQALQDHGPKYVSVRFGNVLGSNGSVVPIFKRQIAAGGPLTVTHPEMRRYFMTIPEAVQLVLQASTMGNGGELFVLDMGEPVKIVDLARNLILLSGLRPGQDIKIEFTGVRPGEKLYEELSAYNENTLPTRHHQIKVFAGNGVPDAMTRRLENLRALCAHRDASGLILELKDLVPDYNPSAYILRRLLSEAAPVAALSAAAAGR